MSVEVLECLFGGLEYLCAGVGFGRTTCSDPCPPQGVLGAHRRDPCVESFAHLPTQIWLASSGSNDYFNLERMPSLSPPSPLPSSLRPFLPPSFFSFSLFSLSSPPPSPLPPSPPPPPPSPSPSLSQSLSFCLSLGRRKRHLCVRIYTGVLCAYAVSLARVPGDRSGCECWKVCRVGRFETVSSMIAGSIDCGGGWWTLP